MLVSYLLSLCLVNLANDNFFRDQIVELQVNEGGGGLCQYRCLNCQKEGLDGQI